MPSAREPGGSQHDPGLSRRPQRQHRAFLSLPAAPSISVPQRVAVAGANVSLPCHVEGFYPKDVDVAWLRDGRVLNNTTPSVPQRNPDGTFSFTLTYAFTSARSDAGSIFSCRVQHLALEQPLREEFPLEVAGQDTNGALQSALGANMGRSRIWECVGRGGGVQMA